MMPFKSKRQQGYFHWLASQGKLPKSINLDEYDKSTDYDKLPDEAEEAMAKGGYVGEEDDEHNFSPHPHTSGEGFDQHDRDADIEESYDHYVSSGEPHSSEDLEDEEPMEFMAKGGIVGAHIPRPMKMLRSPKLAHGGMAFAKALKRQKGRY